MAKVAVQNCNVVLRTVRRACVNVTSRSGASADSRCESKSCDVKWRCSDDVTSVQNFSCCKTKTRLVYKQLRFCDVKTNSDLCEEGVDTS